MKLPDLSKKQKILLASLLGAALLVALIVVIALSGRGAEETVALDEAPEFEDTGDTVAYDDTVDKVTLSSKGGRTQIADPVVTFRADAAHPMPEEGAVLNLGEKFDLGGSILANYPINSVTVHISCAHNNKELYPIRLTVKNTDGKRGAFDLREAKDGEASLVDRIPYDKFKIGYHVLRITASCGDSREIEVYKLSFYVVGEEWEQIRRENFPDSYPEALKFFKDDERFLYRYQWVNGRYILADPDWEKTYITTIPGYPNGVDWKMHVDAVPYMQKAFEYLETSYVRVHGTNGDTGDPRDRADHRVQRLLRVAVHVESQVDQPPHVRHGGGRQCVDAAEQEHRREHEGHRRRREEASDVQRHLRGERRAVLRLHLRRHLRARSERCAADVRELHPLRARLLPRGLFVGALLPLDERRDAFLPDRVRHLFARRPQDGASQGLRIRARGAADRRAFARTAVRNAKIALDRQRFLWYCKFFI